jgi:hypothetical protein
MPTAISLEVAIILVSLALGSVSSLALALIVRRLVA